MPTSKKKTRPVAFVTGASRGIGKAIARQLAKNGFDVAITARTVQEGEQREHSSTVAKSNTTPLPGSLTSTTAEIEAAGAKALAVAADLREPASLGAAVTTVIERWGPIDLLVNNGRYIGPGHMDHIIDTPLDILDAHLQANVMGPLVLTKLVLPGMLERGSGVIMNLTSTSGQVDPPAAAGKGGWGLGYGMSKAAVHRIAGMLAVELGDRGIYAFNIDPGFVWTERLEQDMKEFGFDASEGAPPDVIGAVIAWLAKNPKEFPNGAVVRAQEECAERGLLEGWPRAS